MPSDRERVNELLTRLSRIATELGDGATAEEAASVRDRVNAGQFYVACVGQFKRGKSTLLAYASPLPLATAALAFPSLACWLLWKGVDVAKWEEVERNRREYVGTRTR